MVAGRSTERLEPDACLRCDAKPASFCFGPPLTDKPYRLCFACWMMTPDGVKAIQGQIRSQLGETGETVDD